MTDPEVPPQPAGVPAVAGPGGAGEPPLAGPDFAAVLDLPAAGATPAAAAPPRPTDEQVTPRPGFALILDIEPRASGLSDARDGLRDWLSGVGLGEPGLTELLIAVGEACANAYEHSGAWAGLDASPVRVEGSHDAGRIQLRILDRGRWRSRPSSTGTPGRGRGRMLMTGLVDDLRIDTGPDGTTVELTKYLP